ncbi:DUF4843 domain-containing protein [Chitinophaga sedimenti]|uniref:DUF4843 domain-containing protein n=1 Tax=Chitinophaga sedimenti TaxID=2033606 RepID=UPI003557DBDA
MQKDQYYLFQDAPLIQFGPAPTDIYTVSLEMADTMKPYTFYYEPPTVLQDTAYFDIYALGGVRSEDRPFTLEQINLPGQNNAEPGIHYKAFTDKSVANLYVIKAGQVHARVPIIVLRDPSLKSKTVKLQFEVKANSDFKLGEANKRWRRLELTDGLSRPPAWDTYLETYYFGKYSVTKHAFMIGQTGEKWDQPFVTALRADFSILAYWNVELKTRLVDYNKNHPGEPLKDEYGDLVAFP